MKIVIAATMAALISGIGVGFQGTFNALLQRSIGLVGLICWVLCRICCIHSIGDYLST